jgi:hypothetical protein
MPEKCFNFVNFLESKMFPQKLVQNSQHPVIQHLAFTVSGPAALTATIAFSK